ncbi:50S ribosomal protein L11 methyltransferase [Pedobacter yulinensis]|uniref:Ribosomal protein L11 methyltransferase n=1 Tax=Pedobacter yulinensis TaxID=2126353 RepID=A0A2T3HIA6_9SPHI|nr:50S ribosomal protein L11 methyltransferase [Pedobacter yulinensis]PST82133.1 50S ribosomal protein L11 methyltransferase [Pedobacter yulinensis]
MQYTRVVFTFEEAEEYQQDLLISELADLGFDSFEQDVQGLSAYIQSDLFDDQALRRLIDSFAPGLRCQYTVAALETQNWNETWEKNFNPLLIANACYVRATFHEPNPAVPFEIVIDPKMSFGTGHHQTTAMMIRYLLELEPAGQSVLDMGAGTGILAILAAKKGASKLLAIDYDEICCESMSENAALNGVSNLRILHGSKEVIPDEEFDLILANINRNILLDQIARYTEVLAPGGTILFSGFYEAPDLQLITEQCNRSGLRYIDHKKDGEWVAARFRAD